MPVAPQDRPLASVREETIDQLIVNYGHGKLSLPAFERRLDEALEAKAADALLALTADLPLKADKAYAKAKREELNPHVAPEDAKDVETMVHIFGGTNRSGPWTVAREIRMVNIFGGGDLDFSHAQFTEGVTRVRLFCLFGGANFYVSEEMNTVSRVMCIFGGVDNRAPSSRTPGAPTLVIEGLCLFGGASIKIKRTMKERFLEFAEQVKAAFGPVHHRY
jgi:hypothetical protein